MTLLSKIIFALLVVLRDRVVGIALVDLHFGSFTLRDFANEVEQLVICSGSLREQRNVVPWRDTFAALAQGAWLMSDRPVGKWLPSYGRDPCAHSPVVVVVNADEVTILIMFENT